MEGYGIVMDKKRRKKADIVPTAKSPDAAELLRDLRALIDAGRTHVAQAVNAGMVLLYWSVGDRIRREILGEKRAAYGEQIVSTVSRQLAADYGRGFGRRNLFQMVRFAEAFADRQIVQTLSAQLGWSHIRREDCLDSVDTIDHGLRQGVQPSRPLPDAPLRRGLP